MIPASPPDLFTGRLACAVGAVALGLVTAGFGAFALQYQPVPEGLASPALIYISAAVLILAGAALAVNRTASIAALVLALWFLSWIVLWQFLRMPWHRLSAGALLPSSEVMVLAVGPALLVAREGRFWRIWDGVWLRLFAAAQVVFGLCHFIFLGITASMIPTYVPDPRFWAIATGVAHIAAAGAMFAAVGLRLTGLFLCAMYVGFTVLVCAPLLLAQPGAHLPWLMVLVTALHAAAAWVVSQRATRLERDGLSALLTGAVSGRNRLA